MNAFTKNNKINDLPRLGIPSKGRMGKETQEFLIKCGFTINRNGNNYLGKITELPQIQLVFQRQEDIIKGVASGLLTFGIVGLDLLRELQRDRENIIIVHSELGFGICNLEIAIPEDWNFDSINELQSTKPFRIATKYPYLSSKFLSNNNINYQFVEGAGTLEVSPALGNSDFIIDLVSTGKTLSDNRLKRIQNGTILNSQAVFIGNRTNLSHFENSLELAKTFVEYFEATLRSERFVSVYANIRGTPETVLEQFQEYDGLSGLQGPTYSKIKSNDGSEWFAIHIIIIKSRLKKIISDLRSIGGSGVIVTPVMYIFEEEPTQIKDLKRILKVDEVI